MAHEEARGILRGLEYAHRHGLSAHHVSLSDAHPQGLHLADFNRRFSRLCDNLRRANLRWDHYVSALGCNERTGRLHRHVVAIGGPSLSSAVLNEHAARVGLGNIVVRPIKATKADRARRANYVAHNGLHFAVVHAGLMQRIQPFTRSRTPRR